MTKYKQVNIRMSLELYNNAKQKCKEKFDISLSALVKVFLASFTSQEGVGFYVGDDDICQLFERWLIKKNSNRQRPGGYVLPYPRLRDLYDLGNRKTRVKFY